MSMGMSMSLRQTQSLRMSQVQLIIPPTNWSLLKAYNEEGDQPLRFAKKQLDVSGLELEERLRVIDEANKVFRFAYVRGEAGNRFVGYYKVPLMRNVEIEVDDIKIKIPRSEYETARSILNGAGRLQRIVRAVPCHQIYSDVKSFVEEKGCNLNETVVVSVDRGGRLPSYIVKEILGKDKSYSIKVNQGGGFNGGIDIERLEELINSNILRDKFVLFVDSTVDSGRQIEVLKKYFDNHEFESRAGFKAWGIVGSNENGRNLYNHKDLNWGLNPDQSFEDDPRLMGIDYAPGSLVKVIECPSKPSEAIKNALLEIPRGVVLDLSNLSEVVKIHKAYRQINKTLRSKTWAQARNIPKKQRPQCIEVRREKYNGKRKKLLIIGDSSRTDLREDEANYIANSLASFYDIFAGTPSGNPGFLIERFSRTRTGSATLYQPVKNGKVDESKFGNPVIYHGETKGEFRENLAQSCDAILSLGGNEGTLKEVVFGLAAEKPVYVISDYGAAAYAAANCRSIRKNPNLRLSTGIPSAVRGLREMVENGGARK